MSAYNLRSSGINFGEMNESLNESVEVQSIAEELSELDKLLKPIEEKIESVKTSLKKIRVHLEKKLKRHDQQLNNLRTRMELIEQRMAYFEHSSYLQFRKMDDFEQFSRKINLRLCGIEVGKKESPKTLMKQITDEYLGENGVDLNVSSFDRCHRVGPKYVQRNKTYQDVLLKMCSWNARDTIYKNRKHFKFFVKADLTTRREKLFAFAKNEVASSSNFDVDDDDDASGRTFSGFGPPVGRNIDYVFIDENCKLKIKSKTGKYFMFNSEAEFYNIVMLLDQQNFSSPELLIDEDDCELYY